MVYPKLKAGNLNVVYNSPLGIMALQWVKQGLKYVSSHNFAYAIGALVVREESWKRLNKEEQEILMNASIKYHAKLRKRIMKDNVRALSFLKKEMEPESMIDGDDKVFEEKTAALADDPEIKGRLYDASLLKDLRAPLAELRKE